MFCLTMNLGPSTILARLRYAVAVTIRYPLTNLEGPRLLVMGTGDLAEAVVHSLAVIPPPDKVTPHLVIAGRNKERLSWLSMSTRTRVQAFGTSWRIETVTVDWQNHQSLDDLFNDWKPDAVLHLASLQSPWHLAGNDKWAKLVRTGGFGATAPLQAKLLLELLRAMERTGTNAPVINACYPDFVNVLMKAMGYSVACGIGNIALLASIMAATSLKGTPFRLLANVFHVFEVINNRTVVGTAPLIWTDDEKIPARRVIELLPTLPFTAKSNALTAGSALPLIWAMLGFRDFWSGHMPAPFGLPGGYPVRVANRQLHLDLPSEIGIEQAVAWNRATARNDGVTLESERVKFVGKAFSQLHDVSPRLAQGFQIADFDGFITEFIALRDHLKQIGDAHEENIF
jgi:hypothetical protein